MNSFLSVKDIINILKISRSKAYSIMNDKTLPKYKIGKSLRVNETDFDNWLQNHKNVI